MVAFASSSGSLGAYGYSFIPGQLPGTGTNDTANTGNVGETIFAQLYNTGGNTCTITNASPAVITCTSGFIINNGAVFFTTTGTLPTGLTAHTTYYVVPGSISGNTFQVAASINGAAINTSTDGSGTHTCSTGAWAAANGSVNRDILGVNLTAGDWDIDSLIGFTGATAGPVNFLGSVNTASLTFPGITELFISQGVQTFLGSAGRIRVSSASAFTVYLSAQITTAGTSGATIFGQAIATRAR